MFLDHPHRVATRAGRRHSGSSSQSYRRPVDLPRMTDRTWRRRALFLSAALIAAAACRPERAPVEELYTTRMLGLSYLQRNQLPRLKPSSRSSPSSRPTIPLGYANLGLTYLQAGRYAEAEKQLRRARELDPASTEIGLALAKLYSLTGRSSEARAALERAAPRHDRECSRAVRAGRARGAAARQRIDPSQIRGPAAGRARGRAGESRRRDSSSWTRSRGAAKPTASCGISRKCGASRPSLHERRVHISTARFSSCARESSPRRAQRSTASSV